MTLLASAAAAAGSLDRARALERQGRLDEALAAYAEVARESEASDPGAAAIAYNNSCLILWRQGRYPQAEAECERALELRRAADDARGLGRTLNNLGLVRQQLGKLAAADELFREALAINESRGDREAQVINLTNLGLVADLGGRFGDALDLYRRASDLIRRSLAESWAEARLNVVRLNEGVVYEKVGAFRLALDAYRSIRPGSLDGRGRAALEMDVGVAYRNLGDPVRALESFAAAATAYEESGDEAGRAHARLNQAIALYRDLDDPRAAEQALERALAAAVGAGDRTVEIETLFHSGWLRLDEGRLFEAEEAFAACLSRASESGSEEGRWSALEGLGRVAAARGEVEAALDLFDRAAEIVERRRGALEDQGLRSDYFGNRRGLFEGAVEAIHRLGDTRPAGEAASLGLEWVQRGKVRSLLDTLGTPSEGPLEPRTAAELRALVGRSVLLEYFFAGESVYRWVVTGDGVEMSEVGPAEMIRALVGEIRDALTRGEVPAAESTSQLAKLLLDGTEDLLGGARELRVAADGVLHYLPFEMLQPPGLGGDYLVERLPVVYFPSGSVQRATARERSPPAVDLAALGAPIDTGVRRSPLRSLLVEAYDLGPLPAIERELATASRRLGGRATVRLGADATEEAVRILGRGGARVLHLASHTVVDERPGRGSAVVLAPTEANDGLLYPHEVADLELDTELTVLAACHTALATPREGDAFAGLTGSFLAAGSSAVVATLWAVGDDETAAFMDQFYDRLGRGLRPAEALRRAKLELLGSRDWRAPHLWSAYVLVGEAGAVATRPDRLVRGLAVAVVAALASALVYYLLRRRSA